MAFGFGFGALRKAITASGGGGGGTERVQNGDFSSATGWTVSGGTIAAGVLTGTGVMTATNTLLSAVANGASVSFAADLTNASMDLVVFALRNSGTTATFTVRANTDAGHVTASVTAGATGPYDQLRITNGDGDAIVLDNVSLLA